MNNCVFVYLNSYNVGQLTNAHVFSAKQERTLTEDLLNCTSIHDGLVLVDNYKKY